MSYKVRYRFGGLLNIKYKYRIFIYSKVQLSDDVPYAKEENTNQLTGAEICIPTKVKSNSTNSNSVQIRPTRLWISIRQLANNIRKNQCN
jgi:hypothetical protein